MPNLWIFPNPTFASRTVKLPRLTGSDEPRQLVAQAQGGDPYLGNPVG